MEADSGHWTPPCGVGQCRPAGGPPTARNQQCYTTPYPLPPRREGNPKNRSGLRPLSGSIMTYRLVSSPLELMPGCAGKEQGHHIQAVQRSPVAATKTCFSVFSDPSKP